MSWIENFISDNLRNFDEVQDFEVIAQDTFHITRKEHKPVIISAVAGGGDVTGNSLLKVHEQIKNASFVVVMKKDSVIRESAFQKAVELGVAIGSCSDFLRALREEDMNLFVRKEEQFVVRSISQLSKVIQVRRTDDNKYEVTRVSDQKMILVMLYAYELGADAVRTGWQTYGPCTMLVSANPNAQVSTQAKEAANAIGVPLVSKWVNLLREIIDHA